MTIRYLSLGLFLVSLLLLCDERAVAQTVSIPTSGQGSSINALVLAQIESMPRGGSYATTRAATNRLQSSVRFESDNFIVLPGEASPSYCSGATYLVFLKTIAALRDSGSLRLSAGILGELLIRGQADGQGVWGRWNANGPGTARLFYELGLGRNFSSFNEALPGDFMKIFWTPEVGSAEHGHSVVFLGTETKEGAEYVRFWSSNKPLGYGEKSVPLSKISRVIFSRLEAPANLSRVEQAPKIDPYLFSLQRRRSSFDEARAKCGF